MIFICVTTIIAFVTYLDNSIALASDTSPCGDWEQYKDEHCYKLFDGLKSFSDAEKVCSTNNSSMVSIHYAEEQAFLKNYIFVKKKTVDNVWIGAKYVGNKQFKWSTDNSTLTGYSNWANGSPKNLADHCVEMLADVGLEGKWAEGRCAKGNRVVCQKMPLPSIGQLAQELIELKHILAQTVNKLAQTEGKLENTEKVLNGKIADVEKAAEQRLSETRKEVVQLKKESIPIGFIYVQLPKDKAPQELWPTMTWTDISAAYEGVFFRVVGGGSAAFGQVQPWNAPRLETVHVSNMYNMENKLHGYDVLRNIPVTGWSDSVYTGEDSGTYGYNVKFKMSDVAEVRPKNMAIKVYKRTA